MHHRERWGITTHPPHPRFLSDHQEALPAILTLGKKKDPFQKPNTCNEQITKTILPGVPSPRHPSWKCQHSPYRWERPWNWELVPQHPATCVLPLESSLARWLQGLRWWPDWGHRQRAPSGHSVAKQRSHISPGCGGGRPLKWAAGHT